MLKEIVSHALNLRNVSPEILADVDKLIYRSTLRLQKDDIIPPRKWEFTCEDRKQEYVVDGEVKYNFFYLPEDFRKLDEFRPLESYPYSWTGDEYQLYKDSGEKDTDHRKLFTIVDNNFDEESDYEKILIARPFPKDSEKIQIKYFVNGKNLDWSWLDETYYEAIIMDVQQMLGLTSIEEADEHISRAVSSHKEQSGALTGNGLRTLGGSYFGKRVSKSRVNRKPFKNL